MKTYEVEVKSVSPLLMNRFIGGADLAPTKKKIISTKRVSVEEKLYLLPDGKPYIPARYFEGALIETGKNFKGKGRTNLSKIIGAMVSIEPDAIPLIGAWIEDIQVGVNPMTRGRMEIHRPRFDKWSAAFKLTISTDDIPEEIVKEMLDHAGLYVGVGDWRPAKKGKYGKFIISKFKLTS